MSKIDRISRKKLKNLVHAFSYEKYTKDKQNRECVKGKNLLAH